MVSASSQSQDQRADQRRPLSVKLWWPAIWGHIQAKRKGLKPYYWDLGLFTTEDRKDPKLQKLIQKDPFKGERFADFTKVVSSKKCHAYYDDCECRDELSNYRVANSSTGDYNKHLSNSSYAKVSLSSIVFCTAPYTFVVFQNLDYARMQACVELFSPVFAPGVWMALGAGSYQFLKEIPMLTDYEIHISLAGFEDKWVRSSRAGFRWAV